MDPLAEKHFSFSPYVYVTDNPIIKMDPDGKDGVVVVDKVNKVLFVSAIYYVNTQKVDGQRSSVYSSKQVENMNTGINIALNSKNYSVSEGDYSGYSVKFDLKFKEGGTIFESNAKIGSDEIEGNPISNSITKSNSNVISLFKTIETENRDGTVTTKTVGGVTEEHNKVTMNSSQDTKHNRIHELFHTLFFDKDDAQSGIGSYNNPQNPNQSDINTLINNSALPKVPLKKEDEKE